MDSNPNSNGDNDFVISLDDKANSRRVISSPQCLLAHDFRNYLGVIVGHCELISDADVSEEIADHLRSISRTVMIMTQILNNCRAGCNEPSEKKPSDSVQREVQLLSAHRSESA